MPRMALARQISCLWPTLKLIPPSETSALSPSGISLICSLSCTWNVNNFITAIVSEVATLLVVIMVAVVVVVVAVIANAVTVELVAVVLEY